MLIIVVQKYIMRKQVFVPFVTIFFFLQLF
jgi:hypothetical protein